MTHTTCEGCNRRERKIIALKAIIGALKRKFCGPKKSIFKAVGKRDWRREYTNQGLEHTAIELGVPRRELFRRNNRWEIRAQEPAPPQRGDGWIADWQQMIERPVQAVPAVDNTGLGGVGNYFIQPALAQFGMPIHYVNNAEYAAAEAARIGEGQ